MSTASGTEKGMVHCGRCGYPLVGVQAEGKCPECGEPAANALSAKMFFERDRERLKWTRVGLNMALWALWVEMVWAVIYVGVLLGFTRVGFGHVTLTAWMMGVNALVLWLAPLGCLGGAYLLFYGITRTNRTGWAVRARVTLIWLIALWGVGVGSAWLGLMLPNWYFLGGLYYVMRLLGVFPTALTLIIGVGLVLLVKALGTGEKSLNLIPQVWRRGGAHGAIVVLLMLALGGQYFFWESRGLTNQFIVNGRNNSWNSQVYYTPEWSVYGLPQARGQAAVMIQYRAQAEGTRLGNNLAVHMSDSGPVSLLRWVNIGTWWADELVVIPQGGNWASVSEVSDALSCGLGRSGVQKQYRPNWMTTRGVNFRYWLWPEMVWGVMGLMASGYLWGYLVAQVLRLKRALPRGEK